MVTREEHYANAKKAEAAGNGCSGCAAKRQKRTFVQLARGAIGITKEVLGADAAPDETVDERWATCSNCPKNDRGICLDCGCHLSAKVRLAGESCPDGQW